MGELIWEDLNPYTGFVNTITIDCDYTQYAQINILYNETYYYAEYPTLAVKCCDLTTGVYTWYLYNMYDTNRRTITFANNQITITPKMTTDNATAYNIPVKIYGIKNADSIIK